MLVGCGLTSDLINEVRTAMPGLLWLALSHIGIAFVTLMSLMGLNKIMSWVDTMLAPKRKKPPTGSVLDLEAAPPQSAPKPQHSPIEQALLDAQAGNHLPQPESS
jgi:hypothetical protein